ncbi:MAG: helix-turn-helix domain-containing protein [Thermodesulfobacteriota bacterium]
MKVKKVKIGIKSISTAMDDFVRTEDAAQRGVRTKKETGVYFTSLEAFRKVLTPRRFDLLRLIREREPASLHELARCAGRNIKNVSDDVKYLAQVGLVDLKDTENKISARVNYETILLEIAV